MKMTELTEMIIGNISQNRFIWLINEYCTIKPIDSDEKIEEKRQMMTVLMMMRVKAEAIKLKMEQENDDFDRMVKELLKKKDQ